MKEHILILMDHYLPGFKAGGPIRSIENFINSLAGEKTFFLFTRDRDFGDAAPYAADDCDRIQSLGPAEIFYLSPQQQRFFSMIKKIRSCQPDIIYLNSVFSFRFSIQVLLARRFGLLPKHKLVISSRGEFSLGALKLKSFKKSPFLFFAKLFGLYRSVVWKASNFSEDSDIRRVMGRQSIVTVAPDFAAPEKISADRHHKVKGKLRLIFISRIARMKNLHFALKSLNGLKGDVVFDIYGPIEDAGYWKKCQNSIDSLPTNIQVSYRGQLDHHQVAKTLPLYDLFYLPTLGENFGHIIFEALSAGLPVLISDQTPWLHLETQRAGWDLSLEDQEAFTRVLQACVDMSSEEQDELSKAAVTYVNHYWETSNGYISNKLLFDGGAA